MRVIQLKLFAWCSLPHWNLITSRLSLLRSSIGLVRIGLYSSLMFWEKPTTLRISWLNRVQRLLISLLLWKSFLVSFSIWCGMIPWVLSMWDCSCCFCIFLLFRNIKKKNKNLRVLSVFYSFFFFLLKSVMIFVIVYQCRSSAPIDNC